MSFTKHLFVYILKCADDSYYVGVTNNPERRLFEHNEGISERAYTFSRRPCEMVFIDRFNDFNRAIDWETRIKKWSRKKKEALISGEFHLLPALSKKKFR